MILVTGATGFIGRALVRHLSETGAQVRVLLRAAPKSPRLPRGVPVEVAVVSLNDERSVRAALRGVDEIYHLASAATEGRRGSLFKTDIEGTRVLAQVAASADIKRLIFLSHIGADRASAFPVQKAKGIAEEHIRKSGVPYTIIRSSVVFGPEDRFTNNLSRLLRISPGVFPVPGDGRSMLQPLWVEDLVTCMTWALQNPEMVNQTYEIGGGEYFTLRQVFETLMNVGHVRRLLVPLPTPYMRALLVTLDAFIPNFNVSTYWLDYVAVNRTCPVDNMPRTFGLMPARFGYRLDYLARKPWYANVSEKIQKALRLPRS
ncbi:MAG TPA: NAD-dependent epimerase/dehydratase family protein [Anaerolineales bacterium]|nr:NAD-dependent epimerase/dehydratase family protein [Anaerolineales bacterium]